MGKHTIFVMIALTGVWIILMEYISWQNVATGMFVSMLCMHLIGRFLNYSEIEDVNFYRLLTYPFWLLALIYMDAVFMMRMIFSDAKCGISKERVYIENESLRFLLADSITLTPGSVFVDSEDKEIVLLCIGPRNVHGFPATVESLRAAEKVLKKAVKKKKKGA